MDLTKKRSSFTKNKQNACLNIKAELRLEEFAKVLKSGKRKRFQVIRFAYDIYILGSLIKQTSRGQRIQKSSNTDMNQFPGYIHKYLEKNECFQCNLFF